ncbi:hypothetical protein K0M31_013182 [Melipona bicolor]|uniref:Caspase-1 n=1 Tax=Melipona bicolor TaxID=60889 RepID=A0AA40KGP4_9HYME|nr:hypothetical protein K0M31_013182 [Melipona bicolor]
MFVLMFHLISFGRAFMKYILEKHLAISSPDSEPNSECEAEESDFTRNVDVPDARVMRGMSYTNDIVHTASTHKDLEIYPMNLQKRGKCVIFNHKIFDNQKNREGTEYDQKAIEYTFNNLDFEVTTHPDLNYEDVMEEIGNLSKENYEDCDCICIFILTHGTSGDYVYARDYRYRLSDIWEKFTADNCRTLAGKPKLFFIQACKGYSTMHGFHAQGRSATDLADASYTIPTHADFLYGYSTVEGYYSFRAKEGSCYIQTLCEVINKHWRTTDLLKMLTMTSRKVGFGFTATHANVRISGTKQMPTFSSTLTRDLYFIPKHTS